MIQNQDRPQKRESYKNLSKMMKEMGGDTESRPTQKRYAQKPIDSYFKRKTNKVENTTLITTNENETDNEMVEFLIREMAIIEMIKSEKTHYKQASIDSFKSTTSKVMICSNTARKDAKEKQSVQNGLNYNMREDKICNNCLGYEGSKTLRLICNRLYMVKTIGVAIEIQTLLRRCSYPKRDVIRWSL